MNFIIGGFHHVIVYADGKKPSDVNVKSVIPTTVQPGPPLINDPGGPDLSRSRSQSLFTGSRRSRAVSRVGLFLVICGVLPHFANDGMYGWVKAV